MTAKGCEPLSTDDRRRNSAAASARAGRKMQPVNIFGKLVFERVGQGRLEPRSTFHRYVDSGRESLRAGHQDNDLTIADIGAGIAQGACQRRAAARTGAVNRYPLSQLVSPLTNSYYQEFRHTQVVPRLRRIGATLP